MENRRKFYSGGAWCLDSLEQRYEHIKKALDAYANYAMDLDDLKFNIKNAFVSKIFISVEAEKILSSNGLGHLQSLYNFISSTANITTTTTAITPSNTIITTTTKTYTTKHVLDLQDKGGTPLSPYFDFCKVVDIKVGGQTLDLRIEHVVPSDVYIKWVLNHPFNPFTFQTVFDKIYICIVTSTESTTLNAYKNKMPADCLGSPIDFMKDPFARYDKLGIKIFTCML